MRIIKSGMVFVTIPDFHLLESVKPEFIAQVN